MTKEIHKINSNAINFVAELIDYISTYPDDDYMTMECLCRKLHKHGLIDKEDGEWVADTPQTDCNTCRHYKLACELFSEVCKYEPTTQTETQNSNLTFDTPQTESTGSPIGDYRDGVGAWQTDCGWK